MIGKRYKKEEIWTMAQSLWSYRFEDQTIERICIMRQKKNKIKNNFFWHKIESDKIEKKKVEKNKINNHKIEFINIEKHKIEKKRQETELTYKNECLNSNKKLLISWL